MKLPQHLVTQIIRSLSDIFVERRYADKSVEFAFKHHPKWGSRDRRLFAEAIYEIVRWYRWYWYLAGFPDAEHTERGTISDSRLWHVWAAYWIMQGNDLPFFDELLDVRRGAVLERSTQPVAPAIRDAFPDWLETRATRELGPQWQAMRASLNKPAEVYLRVNTLKTDRKSLKARLGADGLAAEIIKEIPTVVVLKQRSNIFAMPAFKEGLFEVQDASSQRVAPFLQVEPGMRVIDACAGGGGKTLHLAALMQNKGKILALDVHDWKLTELRKRAARAGVDIAETRVIESSKTLKRLTNHADRVLLDVPCSGLGVLRRNPDAKWKLSEEEIDRLIVQQQDILSRYSALVKPGGKLVYATCSILPSENEHQVQQFLSTHGADWTLEEELKIDPATTGHDGFYAARLVRRNEQPPVQAAITSDSDSALT
ncbi:MAG: RsmB/NOP family class I SAM-dependent RNA methyltransferase [Prosthecobacter sp.]|nr:RsmB/NOP family class I SAM-dependent RNA methyltransferase [Prosthecobacter sp.]